MNNSYQLFKQEAEYIKEQLDDFLYVPEAHGIPEITGTLILTDDKSVQIDAYKIRIVCTPDYPMSFPYIYECSGRIPVNIDWHVYNDGHACICSLPDEMLACNDGITLGTFIDIWVKPYFFNQKHRELHGFFLHERSHGTLGNIEFFTEVFKTKDIRIIIHMLSYIKSNAEPNRVNECFCGSRLKYRHCHRDVFRKFKKLPDEHIQRFINFLNSNT